MGSGAVGRAWFTSVNMARHECKPEEGVFTVCKEVSV